MNTSSHSLRNCGECKKDLKGKCPTPPNTHSQTKCIECVRTTLKSLFVQHTCKVRRIHFPCQKIFGPNCSDVHEIWNMEAYSWTRKGVQSTFSHETNTEHGSGVKNVIVWTKVFLLYSTSPAHDVRKTRPRALAGGDWTGSVRCSEPYSRMSAGEFISDISVPKKGKANIQAVFLRHKDFGRKAFQRKR